MTTTHPSILIVGGGPAGTAAALTLLKYTESDIIIIDSTDYTSPRIGETVSPSLLPLLRYLGCEAAFLRSKHVPSFSIDAAWGNHRLQSRDFLFTAQGNGWHLDRAKFDQMLAKKTSSLGGNLFLNTKIVAQKQLKKKWQIIIEKNKKRRKITADFVIDASGRNAAFARSLGSKWKIYDTLIGIACLYHKKIQRQRQQRMIIETTSNGWWYTSPLPKNNQIVVFMTDGDISKQIDAVKNWKLLLEKTVHVRNAVNGNIIFGPKVFPAYSHVIQKRSQKNWLPAGEAASSFDPMSSMGIGYAILSGIYAAKCVDESINGYDTTQNYIENIINNFEKYLSRRKYYYNNEKRWKGELFWKRRHTPKTTTAQ